MSPHRSAPTLKLASRIDKLLQRELDEGIAPQRMVADGLYARDVLLVCDALVGSELQSLASLFRKAAAAPETSGWAGWWAEWWAGCWAGWWARRRGHCRQAGPRWDRTASEKSC